MNTTDPNYEQKFNDAFRKWLGFCQNMINENYRTNFPNLDIPVLRYETGRRYIRVINGTSVFAFIDLTNGDVLKAASWKAPARWNRGNLFDVNVGTKSMTPYGPAYLR